VTGPFKLVTVLWRLGPDGQAPTARLDWPAEQAYGGTTQLTTDAKNKAGVVDKVLRMIDEAVAHGRFGRRFGRFDTGGVHR